MSTEALISILGLLLGAGGIGAASVKLVEYWLKRAERQGTRAEERAEKEEAVDIALAQAQAVDSTAMRGELWEKLDKAQQRNDSLAQKVGELLQENGTLAGQVAVLKEQNAQVTGRLGTALMKNEELEYRHAKDADTITTLRTQLVDMVDAKNRLEHQTALLDSQLKEAIHRRRATDQKD
jgi:chromosome segregation ATPase